MKYDIPLGTSEVTAYSLIELIFGIIGYMTKLFLQHHHHLRV